jgi:predicted acyltransferase
MASLITEQPAAPPTVAAAPTQAPQTVKPHRLLSLDAYRGFIMLVLATGGLGFVKVRQSFPDNPVWRFLGFHTDHVAWIGCSFWDLIQPSFMFMVGVAVPYSMASRRARGQAEQVIWLHVIWRSLLLIALGIFLSSTSTPRTNFTFVNVLTQIGLGYVFLCLLAGRGLIVQFAALVVILIGYWLLFFLWPLPPEGFDYSKVIPAKETWHGLPGFWAHWDKNTNAAAAFDLWFLNLFPPADGKTPFAFNAGGYQTLNFVPSLATMLLGLMAGELLRSKRRHEQKLLWLVVAAVVCLGVGYLAGKTVCPLVKRIWTPSWAIYSTGCTLAMLAFFYAIIDVLRWRHWAWPLVVVGTNSIAMYVMIQLMSGWIGNSWQTHLPAGTFSDPYGVILRMTLVAATLWLICLWMYRRKLFLRI